MNKKNLQRIIFCALLMYLSYVMGVLTVGCSATEKPKTIEYKVLDTGSMVTARLQNELNRLGAEGWKSSCSINAWLILKR